MRPALVHFTDLKSTGSELLVISVGTVDNFKYEGWCQLFSPISPKR